MYCADWISDLSPLSSCTKLKQLIIQCQVSDLTPLSSMPLDPLSSMPLDPLSSMPLLEHLRTGCSPPDHEIFSNLAPLSSCKNLKDLNLKCLSVTDISPLSSLSLLEYLDLDLERLDGYPSVKNISPLSHCKKLKYLYVQGDNEITDLSPLCQCPDLEILCIDSLPLIKDLSLLEKGFLKLRVLSISYLPVDDLSPLTRLQNLQEFRCSEIPETTSLLPLARCYKLKSVSCSVNAKDFEELRGMRPQLFKHY